MDKSTVSRFPLFIVGMPRSGTTLLSSILDSHSQIAICPETHFYTRCWTRRASAEQSVTEVWDRLQQQPGVQDMALTETEVSGLWEQLGDPTGAAHPSDVLRALCTTYARRSEATVWGEKTPDHLAHVPSILRDFPEALVLCIVRDPRDVCLSLDGMPWNRDSLPESAWKWRTYAKRTLRYRTRHPDRFWRIRYEDLLERPRDEIRRLVNWLGIPFEQGMLSFYEKDEGPADLEREPWKKKVHDPIDPENKEKWRTRMPPASRWVVQTLTSPYLQNMGYPSDSVSLDVPFFRDLARVLLSTVKTIARRYARRWKTPPRPPGDYTPTWIRQKRE